MPERSARKTRSDGERSRKAILREAAQLATVEGIDGLSIARLADKVGMSKSGLFAHFGSKEELQLATIDAAETVIHELVIDPAMAAGTAIERLRQLTELYLRHIEDGVYPGGCFFASLVMEIDTREGAVRDRAVAFLGEWLARIETAVRDAQAEGAIPRAEDPEQITFEIEAALFLANAQYVATQGDPAPMRRARQALARWLAS